MKLLYIHSAPETLSVNVLATRTTKLSLSSYFDLRSNNSIHQKMLI